MQPGRLADLPADLKHGVERGHRVLEDHRDLPSPNLPHLVFAELGEVLALEHHFAAHDLAGPLQTHDAESSHGLAATGLPDDA